MFEKRILNYYSIIIGALFLISGLGKVINTSGFSNLIYQYGLGYLMILSPVIVLFEILLGLFLILLINPRRYSMISFFLLIIFTISFSYAHFHNGVNDCGCFGAVQQVNFPPLFSFIRNFILIAMSFILWIKYPKEKQESVLWKRRIILFVMGISIFVAGYSFKIPFMFKSIAGTHRFQNLNVKNTELSNFLKTSVDSTYLVFCFSYTCPHCWNSIENLRQYQKTNTVDRIIVFAVGEQKDKLIFEQNYHPDFQINDLPVTEMDKLTDAYPTSFYIKGDTVRIVIKSELSSPFTFKKMYNLPDSK
jgi:hypothetical protein